MILVLNFEVPFSSLHRISPAVCGGCSTTRRGGSMLNCSFSVPCLTSARYLFAENRGGSISLGERMGGGQTLFSVISRGFRLFISCWYA